MKTLKNLPILGVAVALSSCGALDKLNQPLTGGGFNPLDRAGSGSSNSRVIASSSGNAGLPSSLVNTNDHGFKNGDMVEVAIANAALFSSVPKPGDRYKKVLKVGDTLRVVGGEKDFIRVVTEKGEEGYVSSVMVVSQGYLAGGGVTAVGANEIPLVPDVAPEPEIKGIGAPDPSPIVPPAPVPSITEPAPLDPDPIPVPTIPTVPTAPAVPDPAPAVPDPAAPSLPTGPAPEPEIPGLPQ